MHVKVFIYIFVINKNFTCFRCVPIQHTTSDLHSAPQKLSKIETLRLARNYIGALSQILTEGQSMEPSRFLCSLTKGLSQTTSNLLAIRLGITTTQTTETYAISEWPDFSNFYSDWRWPYNRNNENLRQVYDTRMNAWWENNNVYNCKYNNCNYSNLTPKNNCNSNFENMDFKTLNTLYW